MNDFNLRGMYRVYWVENGVWKYFRVNGGGNAQRLWERMVSKPKGQSHKPDYDISTTKIIKESLMINKEN